MRETIETLISRVKSMNRRTLLLSGGGLAILGYAAAKRPAKEGGVHDAYFMGLQAAVKDAGLARPTMVIDRKRLNQNIATLLSHKRPEMGYRIVAKSLPSLPLLAHVMREAKTDKLMIFHQPFLNLVATELPMADVLLGKPMPADAVARFYDHLGTTTFNPATQVQWLVDTPKRLEEYKELANARGISLRLNFELDVGLHRGGLSDPAELRPLLETIDADPLLTFAGFMGYDPHLASVPDVLGWQQSAFTGATDLYKAFIAEAASHYGDNWAPESMTFNTAGSPTYQMHDETTHATEIAVGSALVKPTHFDTPTLADHVPASFITTPVLKVSDPTKLPVLEALSGPTRFWDRNTERTFFIYGGHWLAEPVSPPGLRPNAFFGRSSNQEMLNGSDAFGVTLKTLIEDFGGGTRNGKPVRAVQVGGPLGAYLPQSLFDLQVDYETFAEHGAGIGHGGIVLFDDTVDMARQAHYAFEFCAHESCGKCTPCRIGAVRGAEVMEKVIANDDRDANLALIDDLCELMVDGSLCAMGGMTPIPVSSARQHFPEDFSTEGGSA